MNARIVNLILLGLCLGLLGIIAYLVYLQRDHPVPVRYVASSPTAINQITQISVRKINATNFLSSLMNRPWNWGALESTNYLIYIERLRAFGCPEETVQDIIITDIAKVYAEKRAALAAQKPAPKYWLPPEHPARPDPAAADIQAQLDELNREERILVRDLLGVDRDDVLASYTGESAPNPLHLEFLEPDRQAQLLALLQSYEDAQAGLSHADLLELARQREADLAELLTPAELFEFQVRNSTLARHLQSRLASFEPSEQEFREIFRLQQTLDRTLNQSFDPDELRHREIQSRVLQDSQDALAAELKNRLGETRYAEYVRSQDTDYQALLQVADRLDLPKSQAEKVYSLKATAQQQRQFVATNPNLTESQRQLAFAGIARETQRSVESILGDAGYRAYRAADPTWIYEMPAPQPEPPPLEPEPAQPAMNPPGFPPLPWLLPPPQ